MLITSSKSKDSTVGGLGGQPFCLEIARPLVQDTNNAKKVVEVSNEFMILVLIITVVLRRGFYTNSF